MLPQVGDTDVLDLIKARRSVPKFTGEPVPRSIVEEMLEAATWAPNHHLTEPWEFFVLEDGAKARFADIRRAFRLTLFPNPQAPEAKKAADKIYRDTAATPVIIAVTTRVSDDPAVAEDDYAATMMAIQNMLLTAAGRGVGTYLRTGGLIRDARLRAFLNLPPDRRITGIVYVGYSAVVPERRRTPHGQKTHWIGGADAVAPAREVGAQKFTAGATAAPSDDETMARDPVCGMLVESATAPARTTYLGQVYYFCADACRAAFEAEPASYTSS